MVNPNCPLCRDRVDARGYLINRANRFERATWDWFNLEMLPMDVGPCQGCHEIKTDVLTKWLNFLVLLEVLYPRPNWGEERKKRRA